MARQAFQPTDEHRHIVEQLTAFGVLQPDICSLVLDANGKPIGETTLRKYFSRELAQGEVRANSKVAQALFKKATGGDTVAMIFWLKCRGRWRESPQALELTGAGGSPLKYRSMSDEELEAIVARAERIRSRRAGRTQKGTG